jgi:hypothetical protein
MNTALEFKKNGYVHLKEFLHLDSCKEFANELKKLVAEKKRLKMNSVLSQSLFMAQQLLINY